MNYCGVRDPLQIPLLVIEKYNIITIKDNEQNNK